MSKCHFCDHSNPVGVDRCQNCGAWIEQKAGSISKDAERQDVPAPEPDSLEAQVLALMEGGKKIEAVKRYRQQTGCDLKNAKDAVEALAAKHGIVSKGAGCAGVFLMMVLACGTLGIGLAGDVERPTPPAGQEEGIVAEVARLEGSNGKERAGAVKALVTPSVRQVWVAPPAGYTGSWVTWHVNGQKAHGIQYRNGKYDGWAIALYDDGSKCYQQHYANGVCYGSDTGWHRNGQKAYEGQYENDNHVGTWRWWKDNGEIESVQEYKDGKPVERQNR